MIASQIVDVQTRSLVKAGGDPRTAFSARDIMRQSRSHERAQRMIIGWFDGDVSGAHLNDDEIAVLPICEEGIGVYSVYKGSEPVPDEILDGGSWNGEMTAYANLIASNLSHPGSVEIVMSPLDMPADVAEVLLSEAERIAQSWNRHQGNLVTDELVGTDIHCEASSMSVASTPLNRVARERGWWLAQVARCSAAPIPEAAWLAERSKVRNPDYRLETVIDVVPDEWVESVVELGNAMGLEAPSAGFEPEPWSRTVEQWREGEAYLAKDGIETIMTLALFGDEVAGFTELGVEPGKPIGQGDTIVAKAHRGQGLGMAAKARNLDVLKERHPEADKVVTWNAVENEHMLAINEALGFELAYVSGDWQKDLS